MLYVIIITFHPIFWLSLFLFWPLHVLVSKIICHARFLVEYMRTVLGIWLFLATNIHAGMIVRIHGRVDKYANFG